jgi:hypothetical protein
MEVARARRLEPPERLEISFYDDNAFDEKLQAAASRDGIGPTIVDSAAFQLAFGFAVLAKQSSPPYAKTQRDHMIAFYDSRMNVILARVNPRLPEAEGMLDLVIAHEIGHALQTRHFSVPEVRQLAQEDQRLAALALLEGDAMLTMLAYQAQKSFLPLGRAILETGERTTEASEYARAAGVEQELAEMPLLTRARLEFPYSAGLGFIGSLYRAGGFDLVNRIYDAPPTTTEQVIHPARYLAGDLPVEVEAPPVPEGYTDMGTGTVGELTTMLALRTCMSPDQAQRAAGGWGGDAFRLVAKDALGGLLWSTVWDTVEDAREFEIAFVHVARCWQEAQLLARSVFAGPPSVTRRGNRVAVLRGIPPKPAKRLIGQLLDLPQPAPRRRPPLGPVRLRPLPAPPDLKAPVARAGRVIAQTFGLSAPIPKGYSVDLDDNVTLFRDEPSPARVVLSISGLVVEDASLAITFGQYVEAIQEEVDEPLRPRGPPEPVQTGLGSAMLQTWLVGESSVTFRLWVIPVCDNSGAVLVAEVAGDAETRARHERWLDTVQPLPDTKTGLCAVLDP